MTPAEQNFKIGDKVKIGDIFTGDDTEDTLFLESIQNECLEIVAVRPHNLGVCYICKYATTGEIVKWGALNTHFNFVNDDLEKIA